MESLKFLTLLAVYVTLATLDHVSGGGPLRSVVNALGVAMPLIMLGHFHSQGIRLIIPTGFGIFYGIFVAALLASYVVVGMYNFADLTKSLLAPVFAILGYNATAFDRQDPQAYAAMRRIGLFLLLLPIGYAVSRGWTTEAGQEVGIFANRNNAALYIVVLSNILFLMGGGVVVIVAALTVVALVFETLGVLVAVVAALLVSLSFRRYLPAYLLAALLGAFMLLGPIELPIGERLQRLAESIQSVTELGLWTSLADLSYADLYVITGQNTDLSMFFRIKHWEDLIYAWTSHGWVPMVFGLGTGSAPFHTDIGLVPHNDYVRFLVEAGPLGLVGFAGITGWLLWSIGRRALLISTATVTIYFFSENLVSNFAAMALYYWFGGYWARHANEPEPEEQLVDELDDEVTENLADDMNPPDAGLGILDKG
ncbi:MAG: hypothetical protein R3E83_10915 [Burkholderiaceae bacterium]